MKKNLAFVLLFLVATCCLAQEPPVMYAVYEGQVKPSMDATYVDAVKKLKDVCQQQKMTFTWHGGSYNGNWYVYLVPIKGFADLDKNMFSELEAKIGKEAHASLWQGIDKCVDYNLSSVAAYYPTMSYMSPPQDEYFRNLFFWFPEVGKEAEADKLCAEWMKLYVDKKSPVGVQTYKMLFGGDKGYVFVGWGKNQADYEAKRQKANEMFGEELSKLWAKTLLITRKSYTRVGWYRTDLSFIPATN